MSDEKIDRRIQRTRELLKTALIRLVDEKGYDSVTIQDITDCANLGRTTFYLHYQSKDDLLLDHHADVMSHFTLGSLTYDQLMGDVPSTEFEEFLRQLAEGKMIYLAVTRAKDGDVIMRGIRQQFVESLRMNLAAIFPESHPAVPLEILINYLAGAQLAMIDWWLTTRTPYSAGQLAAMLHRLQRTAVCDMFNIPSK